LNGEWVGWGGGKWGWAKGEYKWRTNRPRNASFDYSSFTAAFLSFERKLGS
jgi:hypothetical protein